MTRIDLKHLEDFSPFHVYVWGYYNTEEPAIGSDEVSEAIKTNRLRDTPCEFEDSREEHIQRIAYMVENPDRTPIHIDVGVPALSYSPEWLVQDGHHRLAAAFYSGRSWIEAEIDGDLDYAVELFELHGLVEEEWSLTTARTEGSGREFE